MGVAFTYEDLVWLAYCKWVVCLFTLPLFVWEVILCICTSSGTWYKHCNILETSADMVGVNEHNASDAVLSIMVTQFLTD